MVCLKEDNSASCACVIYDNIAPSTRRITIFVPVRFTVAALFKQVATQFHYDDFELVLQKESDLIVLNSDKEKKIRDIGFNFEDGANNKLLIKPINKPIIVEKHIEISVDTCTVFSDDHLDLGASASPTESNSKTEHFPPMLPPIPPALPPALPMLEGVDSITSDYKSLKNVPRQSTAYVGLVNQAMTCYLNSLLQALFMTPEFRNALYNWEFDGDAELKSIPYQLQKLFLNLQTSSKLAVETTDLTKSFGWDSTEAWQQHDIQELCRVMFDALEQKFKNTKQSDLINRLYEGKMIDYVKCLECGTEKTREDKFLDVPLPVRPFGSTAAYESVEEAMRAFVQPETLDGNNQYFCEKCNKKCDAHKGLKFSKFSYILTLHLKRFDFDYQTLHRIKLNDRVTFPQTLNLNGFINNSNSSNLHSPTNGYAGSSENSSVKTNDDCSNGSAFEDDGGSSTNSTNAPNNNHDSQEVDEGIDMTSGTDIRNHTSDQPGPFVYELFAIMIHSGNASGGHYYAYIKDFESGEWYCFNDQTVTTITQDDIQKSFGGGSKAYYSGAYSSSINAYMLMYRQVDGTKNCSIMKDKEFPAHIIKLLQKLKEKEESDRKLKDLESEMQKLRIYCFHPKDQRMVDCKLYMANESSLEETLREAHIRLRLEDIVPVGRCRLVTYDSKTGICEISFETREQDQIGDIMSPLSNKELLLETRDESTEFELYEQGGIVTRVFVVDTETNDINDPVQIRCMLEGSIGDLKRVIATKLELKLEYLTVAMLNMNGGAKILDNNEITISREQIYPLSKLFVSDSSTNSETKLKSVVERFDHIITLHFVLPRIDKDILEKLSIPPYEPQEITQLENNSKLSILEINENTANSIDEIDAKPMAMFKSNCARNEFIPPVIIQQTYEIECNSEDSSLSDGDRTLVESVPDDVNALSSKSHSPIISDQLLSSPDETQNKMMISDEVNLIDNFGSKKMRELYFKATEYFETSSTDNKPTKILKVLVDRNMVIGKLKENLEPLIKVPRLYFKIFRLSSTHQAENECTRMTETLKSFMDGERLVIELGRMLEKGEYKLKVYYLKLSDINDETEDKLPFLCEWIFRSGSVVGDTKREILKHIATLDNKFNMPYEKCRLRKKSGKSPQKVYLDDQKFDHDVSFSSHMEFVLQDLTDGLSQEVTDPDDIVVFVRKWLPSEMVLEPFQEITMTKDSEFIQTLSDLSGIPVDCLEYAKLNSSFSRSSISVMSVHSSLSWSGKDSPLTVIDFPLSGYIFFYRDSREQLKELTPEERRELNSRVERLGSSSIHSPRREKALKIYLDSSPKKRDN